MRFFAALALGLLALGAAPARAADGYDIDVVLPLTGNGAFLGKQEQEAMFAVEKSINAEHGVHGKPVRFVFHDDQTSPQVAVQLATDIVARQPAIIFGSTISAICNAMAPLMKNGPVMWCFSPSIRPEPGGYVFTSQIASRDQQRALLTYFRDKGWKRIALITTTDASGQDAERAITGLFKEPDFAGMALVANEHFNASDVTVSAQIENIRAANPQVVIHWATAAAGGTVFRGLKQAGLDLPTAASGSNMTVAQMTQYAAFLPARVYFGVSQWAANGNPAVPQPAGVTAEQKLFFAAAKANGFEVDVGTELGWEPLRVVVSALNELPPGATAAQLHDFLEHWKGHAGVDGVYDFVKVPQRGLDISNAVVVRWDPHGKDWHLVSKQTGTPIE